MTYSTYLLPIEQIIERIVTLNSRLRDFWSDSHGWAPTEAADLLSRSRLDWQVALSRSLKLWISCPVGEESLAVQILGYANLGSLVEGTMKLFLGVYFLDYKSDAEAIVYRGSIQEPDVVKFERLRQFFNNRIWFPTPSDNWNPWIERIQYRRNSIHAFKDRDIGSHSELIEDIRNYLIFLRRISNQLPYPDGVTEPLECDSSGRDRCILERDAPVM